MRGDTGSSVWFSLKDIHLLISELTDIQYICVCLGVYLSRYSDLIQMDPLTPGATGEIVIFKVMKVNHKPTDDHHLGSYDKFRMWWEILYSSFALHVFFFNLCCVFLIWCFYFLLCTAGCICNVAYCAYVISTGYLFHFTLLSWFSWRCKYRRK